MRTSSRVRRRIPRILALLALAVVVATAGCAGIGNQTADESNSTLAQEQTQEPAEPTQEPTPEPTEPTDEPAQPTQEPTDGSGDAGGDGEASDGIETGLLLAAIALVVVGFVAATLLRRRGKADSTPETSAPAGTTAAERQSDGERVISLLHENNGRVFVDVLERELDWSPAHTRRVLDGLVASGDVELTETDSGTLVVFAEP